MKPEHSEDVENTVKRISFYPPPFLRLGQGWENGYLKFIIASWENSFLFFLSFLFLGKLSLHPLRSTSKDRRHFFFSDDLFLSFSSSAWNLGRGAESPTPGAAPRFVECDWEKLVAEWTDDRLSS